MRLKEALLNVRWDFRFRADAFHGVSDEPSPLRVVKSHLPTHPVGVAALPLQSTRIASKLAYCFKNG